jgi:hypothetical protein
VQGADFAVGCARSVIRQKPWSICSRTLRLSGKPIECREMLKHKPRMVEDDSHMVIPRLVETRLRSKLLSEGTSTFGWSHKTSKNPAGGWTAATWRPDLAQDRFQSEAVFIERPDFDRDRRFGALELADASLELF